MNKKLLSVAVAAAMVAPMLASADATLYGRVRTHLVYTDTDATGVDDEWDVEDQSSRLGVKGSEDLGNGLKAIYQYEFDVDAADDGTFSGRLAYVGLSGGFGTMAIGRQWLPYYGSVDKIDVYDVNSMNDTYLGPTRTGNAISYISPNFSGFSAKLALIVSDEGGLQSGDAITQLGDDTVDAWNLSADYNNGPLSVGASYLTFEGDIDTDLWGIAGSYKFGDMFKLIAQYEDFDSGDADIDADEWTIMGLFYFGNNTITGSYGSVDVDVSGSDDDDQWVLGFKHNFSKRTSVHVEYEDSEVGIDHERFGVGIRHDF